MSEQRKEKRWIFRGKLHENDKRVITDSVVSVGYNDLIEDPEANVTLNDGILNLDLIFPKPHYASQSVYGDVKIGDNITNSSGVISVTKDNVTNALGYTPVNSSEITLTNSRIDNLAKLNNGSTTGDAELADARVSAKGIVYNNTGENIRSQYNSLDNALTNSLSTSALKYGYKLDLNRMDLWKQGWINDTGEVDSDTSSWHTLTLRTDYISNKVEYIKTDGTYLIGLRIYDKSDKFISGIGLTSSKNFVKEYRDFNHDLYNYKLLLVKKLDGAYKTITRDEYTNIMVYGVKNTDTHIYNNTEICNIIKSVNSGFDSDYNNRFLWEQGFIKSTTGENSDLTAEWSARSIRTISYIPNNVNVVRCENGYMALRVYDKNNNFIECIGDAQYNDWFTVYSKFNHELYNYRLIYSKKWKDTLVDDFKYTYFHKSPSLIFERDSDYGVIPNDYYNNTLTISDGFTKDTLTAEVYSKYDELTSLYPNYITKNVIGNDCVGTEMYSYTFTPPTISNNNKKKPKFIIQSGIHGYEKSAVFGLYYFLKDMCENWDKSKVLEYFRHNVKFIIVPVVTPTAFDTFEYTNANKVNINRNFDCNWKLGEIGTGEYGGTEPFSEPESTAIKNLVESNLDANLFIDFHNCGDGTVDEYKTINWISLDINHNKTYAKLANVANYHIVRTTSHFNKDYNLNLTTELCGHYTGLNNTRKYGLAKSWACDQGILGLTFEGFNGFPKRPAFTSEVYRANSELIGNWLLAFLNYYKK